MLPSEALHHPPGSSDELKGGFLKSKTKKPYFII
jgi:hypothetical protein